MNKKVKIDENKTIISSHTHIFMGNANDGRVYTFDLNSTKNGFLILDLISKWMEMLQQNEEKKIVINNKDVYCCWILTALFEEFYKQSPLYSTSIPPFGDNDSQIENTYCHELLEQFKGDVGEWDYVNLGTRAQNHFNNLKQNKILSIYQQE